MVTYRDGFTCPQTVTHPDSNRLIATRPGVDDDDDDDDDERINFNVA